MDFGEWQCVVLPAKGGRSGLHWYVVGIMGFKDFWAADGFGSRRSKRVSALHLNFCPSIASTYSYEFE